MSKLPWTYWPIMLVGLVLAMFLSGAAWLELGLDPIVGATCGGLVYGLRETWIVARRNRA